MVHAEESLLFSAGSTLAFTVDDNAHQRARTAFMPRTIIDLPLSQLHDLDARCASLGISRAEAVRRAVEAFLRETATISGFGLWNGAGTGPGRRERAADDVA